MAQPQLNLDKERAWLRAAQQYWGNTPPAVQAYGADERANSRLAYNNLMSRIVLSPGFGMGDSADDRETASRVAQTLSRR